jgi:hypothetical protein
VRASSLSQPAVIDLLSRYFVPVLFSVDGYGAPPRDRAEDEEYSRIRRSARELKYSAGLVCVYLLDPAGDVLGTLGVEHAEQPAQLLAFLRRTVELHRLRPRDLPQVRATIAVSTAPPPVKSAGGRILHVWTVPQGKSTYHGTSHDWVELDPAAWRVFLPAADARPDDQWNIPSSVAERFGRLCYPLLPNFRAEASHVRSVALRARVRSVQAGQAEIALEGRLQLEHPLAGKKTAGAVAARLVGVAVVNLEQRTLCSLEILADPAEYAWQWRQEMIRAPFAAVVQLVP